MRRLLAVVVACALTSPALLAATGRGVLVGTAKSDVGLVLANHIVQLRTLSTGQLVSSTTSSASGEYRFANLETGRYAVEVLNPAGRIVGTTAANVSSGTSTTGVAVASSSAAIGAWLASVAAGAGTAAIGGAAGSVASAATSAGVSAATAVRPRPSASQ
jgi:hypothetical protein